MTNIAARCDAASYSSTLRQLWQPLVLLLLALGSAHTLLLGVGSEQKAEPDPAFGAGITCLSGCQLFCQVVNSELPAAACYW